MIARRAYWLLALSLAACNEPDTSSDDLAVPAVDMAADLNIPAPDLSTPIVCGPLPSYDLAWSSCAGTALAGTCAAAFFDAFAACFLPGGHCTKSPHNFGIDGVWQSGATYSEGRNGLTYRTTYAMGKNICMQRTSVTGTTVEQLCGVDDPSCTTLDVDGGTVFSGGALYDSQSGIFTCPDGTPVNLGPQFGNCPTLDELLNPLGICDGQTQPGC